MKLLIKMSLLLRRISVQKNSERVFDSEFQNIQLLSSLSAHF
jgi:hypothetical protein